MTARHFPAPEAADIARDVIQHHDRLLAVRIEFVFRNEAVRRNNRVEWWGRAHKVTGWKAMLATPDADESGENCDFFVIELAYDIWILLNAKQKRALIDHELCHLDTEITDAGDLKLLMRRHDVEEFTEIVARHGVWRPDLQEMIAAAGPTQLRLLADSGDDTGTMSIAPEAEVDEPGDDSDDEPELSPAERAVLGLDTPDVVPTSSPPSDADLAEQARALVSATRVASPQMLTRRLKITVEASDRILNLLEASGVVGPSPGPGQPREVLVTPDDDTADSTV